MTDTPTDLSVVACQIRSLKGEICDLRSSLSELHARILDLQRIPEFFYELSHSVDQLGVIIEGLRRDIRRAFPQNFPPPPTNSRPLSERRED